MASLNPGGGIYKAENFVFSPVSSLYLWRSHLFCMEIMQPGLPGSGVHK